MDSATVGKFETSDTDRDGKSDRGGGGDEPEAAFKVKVACRVRPLIKRDLAADYQMAISVDLNTNMVGSSDAG